MIKKSKGDKLREGYQKALLTSLLDPDDPELSPFVRSPRPKAPTSSEQPPSSKVDPCTFFRSERV